MWIKKTTYEMLLNGCNAILNENRRLKAKIEELQTEYANNLEAYNVAMLNQKERATLYHLKAEMGQSKLAKEIGVDTTTIWRALTGKRIKDDTYKKIIKYLGNEEK